MKIIRIYLLLCLVMLWTGCSSDDNTGFTPGDEVVQSKTITISVGMPETSSPSRVNFDDVSRSFTWGDGDCLIVLGYGPKGYIGSSDFNLASGSGQKSATFIGKTVAGATEYVVYYKTQNLSFTDQPTGQKLAVMSYDGQTQHSLHTTTHLKDYLLLQSERMKCENFEQGKFRLKVQNSIMRYDIESVPDDMGRIVSIIWENNKGTNDAHSTTLTLAYTDVDSDIGSFEDNGSITIPLPAYAKAANKITAFLCFDPEAMKLKANHKLTVTFKGTNKTYQTDVTAGKDMNYKRGTRYHAKVSTIQSPDALSNWKEIKQ